MIFGQGNGFIARHNIGLDFLPLMIAIILSSLMSWRNGSEQSRLVQMIGFHSLIGVAGLFLTFGGVYFKMQENFRALILVYIFAQLLFVVSLVLQSRLARQVNIELKFNRIATTFVTVLSLGIISAVVKLITQNSVLAIVVFIAGVFIIEKIKNTRKNYSQIDSTKKELQERLNYSVSITTLLYIFSTLLMGLFLRPFLVN